MKKRTYILVCLMFVALFAGITWSVLRNHEPSYAGRDLSSWLDEYEKLEELNLAGPPTDKQIEKTEAKVRLALEHIGTNAIPSLLKWAQCNDSTLKEILFEFASKHKWLNLHIRTGTYYHSMAMAGFYVLGSAGKAAVPVLIKSLQSRDYGVQRCAVDCLGNIGPEARAAVPLLLRSINDTNWIVQWDTIIMVGRIHQQPEIAVPALTNKLNATNKQMVIQVTIDALGAYGEDAKAAVPILQQFVKSTNAPLLKYEAEEALKKINHDSSASK